MSTFSVLYLLDETLFNNTISAGIVSYSLEHAQHIFKKIIGHALDTMLPELKPRLGIVQRSAREIVFNNGSTLRVDTTLRGGAYQLVLISEFGKTCARSPIKAEEIITGTLNTLPQSGVAIIESTGEGNEGYFADMCHNSALRGNENLAPLDYYLHFFPWYLENSYRQDFPVTYGVELTDYFNKIELESGSKIDQQQRYWYAQQATLLGDKIKQEFPSSVQEAFLSSSDAYYFADGVQKAYEENRCVNSNIYDAQFPVYCAFDIGVNDLTVIIFFQIVHGEIRIIDYYEDKNKGLDFYATFLLQSKPYRYSKIFLPHDSTKRSFLDITNTYERDMRKYFAHTETAILVLPKKDKQLSISHCKIKLDRCVFNLVKVKDLVNHLMKYRKKWSEITGRYLDEPFHDEHSHYADAFQYAMEGVAHIEAAGPVKSNISQHRKAVQSRKPFF